MKQKAQTYKPTPATRLEGITLVEFRVRNLQDSVAFYRDVLGLDVRPNEGSVERVCVCVGAPDAAGARFRVVLTEGLPPGTELAGLDHVGMSVLTEQDVRDTYAHARKLGYRATRPRSTNKYAQTFVFDPDGYKIEVRSKETSR